MLSFLIEKEFKQLKRNPVIPRLPLMAMLVFPWAANQEVRDVRVNVVDNDHSTLSSRITNEIGGSAYFNISGTSDTYGKALESVEADKSDIVFEIPHGFEKSLVRGDVTSVLVAANAVNGTKGSLGSSYLMSMLSSSTALKEKTGNSSGSIVTTQYKFNPSLDYKVFMLPALMVMLLTIICGFLPALSIVSEKETGTIEQMNVTPVGKFQFILAKLIPFWVIGIVVLSICFILAMLVYGLVPAGSILTVLTFAAIYILAVSGMGLVISNYAGTMQQAMFIMFFFLMILLLMSGLFTPVASMPDWAQAIAFVNPLKYFMEVMRLVYLKGSTFSNMVPQFAALCSFAAVLGTWAVISYRKSA